jgi:hypothetical protein
MHPGYVGLAIQGGGEGVKAKHAGKQHHRRKARRRKLKVGAAVLALSGSFLTAASHGGHVAVTSGDPPACVQFRAGP